MATAILSVIAGLAFIAFQQRNIANAEALRADQNFRRSASGEESARQALAVAEEQITTAVNQKTIAEEQRYRAENQERINREQLYAAQMNLAMQSWLNAGVPRMVELINNQIPRPGQQDLRGFEWFFLWGLANSELRTIKNSGLNSADFDRPRSSVVFLPGNRKLVSTGPDNVIRILDVVII